MFICKPCLEKNYTNWYMAESVGNCEICGNRAVCHDIPSKYLNPKKGEKPIIKTTEDLLLFIGTKQTL